MHDGCVIASALAFSNLLSRASSHRIAEPNDWVLVSDVDGVDVCSKELFPALYEPLPDKVHMYRTTTRILARKLTPNSYALRFIEQTPGVSASSPSAAGGAVSMPVGAVDQAGSGSGTSRPVRVSPDWSQPADHFICPSQYFEEKYALEKGSEELRRERRRRSVMFENVFLPHRYEGGAVCIQLIDLVLYVHVKRLLTA